MAGVSVVCIDKHNAIELLAIPAASFYLAQYVVQTSQRPAQDVLGLRFFASE
jgi:hypothetical protein